MTAYDSVHELNEEVCTPLLLKIDRPQVLMRRLYEPSTATEVLYFERGAGCKVIWNNVG